MKRKSTIIILLVILTTFVVNAGDFVVQDSSHNNLFVINDSGNATLIYNMTIRMNLTVEGIRFEKDPDNHKIYDNTTCLILTGSTSELQIC